MFWLLETQHSVRGSESDRVKHKRLWKMLLPYPITRSGRRVEGMHPHAEPGCEGSFKTKVRPNPEAVGNAAGLQVI